MKKIILLLILSYPTVNFACPACEKAQPELLKGISHGTGPKDNWDYLIVSIVAFIVVLCFCLVLKYLIKPDENRGDHIKNQILN